MLLYELLPLIGGMPRSPYRARLRGLMNGGQTSEHATAQDFRQTVTGGTAHKKATALTSVHSDMRNLQTRRKVMGL